MQYLDGVTSGHHSFSGQIGKDLQFCEQQPIFEFETIETQLLVFDSTVSTDPQYEYDIVVTVSSGHCSSDFAEQNPGKLSHAIWLTTANCISRLYLLNTSLSHYFLIW